MYQIEIVNKKIRNINGLEDIIVSGDNLTAEIQFKLKKSDYANLVGFTWYIQYANRYGQGESVLLDVSDDDTNLFLKWSPNAVATQVAGRMEIQLYCIKDSKKWMTKPFVIYIDDNLNPEIIGDFTPTAYQQFLELIEVESNKAIDSAAAASESEANALAYKNSASSSASSAATSEDNALNYKNQAEQSAINAATSEANALNYKNQAEASANSIDTTVIESTINSVDQKVDNEINRSTNKDVDHDFDINIIKNAFSNLTANNGKLKLEYIPQGAISKMVTVGSQSAMLALNSNMVQTGDTVRRSDLNNQLYYVVDTNLLGSMSAFAEYQVDVDWGSILNKPSYINSLNNFNNAVLNNLLNTGNILPQHNIQETIGSEVKKYLKAHIKELVSETINNSGTINTNQLISNIIDINSIKSLKKGNGWIDSNFIKVRWGKVLVNSGANDITLSKSLPSKPIFGFTTNAFSTSLITSLNISYSTNTKIRIYANMNEWVSYIVFYI